MKFDKLDFDKSVSIIILYIKLIHQNNYESPLMLTHCHWGMSIGGPGNQQKHATKEKILANQFPYFEPKSSSMIRTINFQHDPLIQTQHKINKF